MDGLRATRAGMPAFQVGSPLPLRAGATRVVEIRQPLALSNKGGVITLIDDKGLKVHGVAYTREQARNPGWTLVF